MKVLKNPWVSGESYFIPTGKGYRRRGEIATTNGVELSFWDGKWNLREATYYTYSLEEMPVVGSLDLKNVITKAILNAVGNNKENKP